MYTFFYSDRVVSYIMYACAYVWYITFAHFETYIHVGYLKISVSLIAFITDKFSEKRTGRRQTVAMEKRLHLH